MENKEEIIMRSPTYGPMTIHEIVDRVIEYIKEDEDAEYEIAVGTDSQNHDRTKIVLALVVRRIGKGGIFFFQTTYLKLIKNVREKLIKETQMSLELADTFLKILEDKFDNEEFDYTSYKIKYQVHVDAGYHGKTSELIPELMAWVRGCGYDVSVKPESFAASSIANKISK